MNEKHAVCLTFDAALEKAVEMEEAGFRNYLQALRKVRNPQARELLRDVALEELAHKQQLEKALLDGALAGDVTARPVPVMNLDHFFGRKEIGPDAGVREALAYAIHLEKEAVEFYRKIAAACSGAPMAGLFTVLLADESRHLRALEDLYEEHFLTEN
ncbi:MAG: ferritin [Deltaproteobacteria bacterium]|nr:MAG: ferritin [Deltaproteobacteria bacterium]